MIILIFGHACTRGYPVCAAIYELNSSRSRNIGAGRKSNVSVGSLSYGKREMEERERRGGGSRDRVAAGLLFYLLATIAHGPLLPRSRALFFLFKHTNIGASRVIRARWKGKESAKVSQPCTNEYSLRTNIIR